MNQTIKFVDEIGECSYCHKKHQSYFLYEKRIYCRNCLISLRELINITLENF
jgi:late competence protein required for DNA uptake (superfamily II DNA/RNA helicase)